MPVNVSEALDIDTSEIVTVIRTSGGWYIGGIYQKGIQSTFKTVCSVQQPTPEELQNLPEGERNKDVRKFISKKPIRTTSDRDGVIADLVRYKGFNYKIISAGNWDSYGHTIAFGARDQ
jgi:hypothetical protein